MTRKKKRPPRVGDSVRFKEDTDYPGQFGIIKKIKRGEDCPYRIQFGDHYDPEEESFTRGEFLLQTPCLGHPLTDIFQ
jgi:hypothetical protein